MAYLHINIAHHTRGPVVAELGHSAEWRRMISLSALAVTMGILSLLLGGCGRQEQGEAPQPKTLRQASTRLEKTPEIASESEEGFHDLVFYVREYKSLADGTQTIRAEGVHNGRPVAFEVALSPTWAQGSLGKGIPLVTYQGTVTYRSVGIESDTFVQVLDELYGAKLSPMAMRKETVFTGITLGGDPRDLGTGAVKIKLFYESDAEDRYAELYTNIDLASRKLYFNEKDVDYRVPVVRALQAE
jgi:hypothetical protein